MLATTLPIVARRDRDPKIQAAITTAMRTIVEQCGGQIAAAKKIRIGQSRVSAVQNGLALVEVDTLVRMQRVLGWSWEQLLGQARVPAAGLLPPPAPESDSDVGAVQLPPLPVKTEIVARPRKLAKTRRR